MEQKAAIFGDSLREELPERSLRSPFSETSTEVPTERIGQALSESLPDTLGRESEAPSVLDAESGEHESSSRLQLHETDSGSPSSTLGSFSTISSGHEPSTTSRSESAQQAQRLISEKACVVCKALRFNCRALE